MAIFMPESQASQALEVLRQHPLGKNTALIGQITGPASPGHVHLQTAFGTERSLIRLSGEQLPRIC
jgi:hydrogenase expression/formation protein HypE